MRVSKKDRKENAIEWYQTFMNSGCNKSAIVIDRKESSNLNLCRVQFLAVNSTLAFAEKPIVIAESNTLGIDGCFMELIDFIKGDTMKKSYWDNHFNTYLQKTMGFKITYRDGLVLLLERTKYLA
jgi:hypothetical protein